jgi:O-methyltransferase
VELRNEYNLLKHIERKNERAIIHHHYHKKDSEQYEPVFPDGTLAPWKTDSKFLSLFEKVKPRTLLDLYRLWQLYVQVKQAQKVKGDIVEIGSWRGGSAFLMAATAREKKVFLCDTFTGVVKADKELDPRYRGGEHADTSLEEVQSFFAEEKSKLCDYEILQGMFPEETGEKLASDTFSLVHIDVDVYRSAKDSFEYLWPKLSSGGLVIFDDYGFEACAGVRDVVLSLAEREDLFFTPLLSGQALLRKR